MVNLMINGAKGWQVADLKSGEQVALIFEESDIAEMSFKCSGTIEFKLPATAKNNKIFANLNDRQVRGVAAYNRYECKLFSDWILVFPLAYCIVSKTTLSAFTVSIISGTADIFARLQSIDFEKNPECLGAVHRTSARYDLQQDAQKEGIIQQFAQAGGIAHALPLIPITTIKQRLEAFGGFSMPTPLSEASNAFPENYYLSFCSKKRAGDKSEYEAFEKIQKCKGSYVSTQSELRIPKQEQHFVDATYGGDFLPSNVKGVGLHVQIVLQKTNTSYSGSQFKFTFGYNGIWYTMQYTLNGTPLSNGFKGSYVVIDELAMEVYIKDLFFHSDGSVYNSDGEREKRASGFVIQSIPANCSEMYWGYADYEITKTEQVAGITYLTYSPSYPTGCYFCNVQPLLKHDNDYAEAYGKMNIAENIGYKNALELYRALMQAFGLITHYDARNGLLTYQLADVRNIVDSAVDWSEKLIASEDEHHASRYAQEMTYAMAEDNEAGVQRKYTIQIADKTLEDKKSKSISLMSGSNETGFRWYRETADGNKWHELKSPYLVVKQDRQITFDAPRLFVGYRYIEQMARDGWRELNAEMALSVVDISTLNATRPIYLRQYGAYFYVEKIENWQSNKTCRVKLLRI